MDYASNSHKSKEGADTPGTPPADEEKPQIEKVIEGQAIIKKKGFLRRGKDLFFAADFGTVFDFVIADVILPALRDAFVDTAARGAERLVYSDRRPTTTPRPTRYQSRIQYNRPPDPRSSIIDARSSAHIPDQRMRAVRSDAPQIIVPTRGDADHILETMMNYLDKYGVVALAELKELAGLETSHTDQKWGWNILRNVPIRQVREGYVIDLPPMEEI